MKSTFIGGIFLEDFQGRQVLYIWTETELDYIEDAATIYTLQVLFSLESGLNSATEAAGPRTWRRRSRSTMVQALAARGTRSLGGWIEFELPPLKYPFVKKRPKKGPINIFLSPQEVPPAFHL